MTNKKRHNLWIENPFCHWCGIEVIFENLIDPKEVQPDNLATIDHLYHKWHPKRRHNRNKVVLACYRCNQDRNEIFKTIYRNVDTQRLNLIGAMLVANNPNDIDEAIRNYYAINRKEIDKLYDAKT